MALVFTAKRWGLIQGYTTRVCTGIFNRDALFSSVNDSQTTKNKGCFSKKPVPDPFPVYGCVAWELIFQLVPQVILMQVVHMFSEIAIYRRPAQGDRNRCCHGNSQSVPPPAACCLGNNWLFGSLPSLRVQGATVNSSLSILWKLFSWATQKKLTHNCKISDYKLCHHNFRAAAAKSLQSCPTLCNPRDGSPPGSPVPGILQARTLEWVAVSFSNAWKWKLKVKALSPVWPSSTPWTAAFQAPPSMGFSRQEYWSGVPLLSPTTSEHPSFDLLSWLLYRCQILSLDACVSLEKGVVPETHIAFQACHELGSSLLSICSTVVTRVLLVKSK